MNPQSSNSHRLVRLCEEILAERPLFLLGNRGPLEYQITETGQLQPRRGSGGVAGALGALSQHIGFTWIVSAVGEGDRKAAEQAAGTAIASPLPGQQLKLRFVVFPRSIYHKYYYVFCNPLLWFLQHQMWSPPHTPTVDSVVYDAWANGYVPVNQAFAQAVAEEASSAKAPPIVMIHDYHLYLAPGYVRRLLPHSIIQHFTHIPWPGPDQWYVLPSAMRSQILGHLCACDIVGLQTHRDVHNFLLCCQTFLQGAEVDIQRRTVWWSGHLTMVNPYPVSVDVAGLRRMAHSPRVKECEEKLKPHLGELNIVRVDRAEPSKNIVRGFRAFEILLDRHPELVGKVSFLAFLVPARTHLKQYQRYHQEILGLADAINAKYGDEARKPVKVFFENNYLQAIAGMRLYDVLLVNAVVDGMSLVAKEGPIVNTKDGVLILSEAVGAQEQLGEYALIVTATDLEATAEALYTALTMSPEERKRRIQALRRSVEQWDIDAWLYHQFEDLRFLACQLPLLARREGQSQYPSASD